MDKLVKRYDYVVDDDLAICDKHGVAYQRDMKKDPIRYDDDYLARYQTPEYMDGKVAQAVVKGRVNFLREYVTRGTNVLDIGACTGAFMKAATAAGYYMRGYDVIDTVVSRLKEEDCFEDKASKFDALTMWDSIEHMRAPEVWLSEIKKGAHLLVAVPIMENIQGVRNSKHYKPGEHLYYWTEDGFKAYMALYGFRWVGTSNHETHAGRKEIGAFAFVRDLPDYRDYVSAYEQMHFTRHYGSSATGLYLEMVASIVKELHPMSILDFGCGRSDLVAHFWNDGSRRIERYDPAIPALREMPDGFFSLVLCCDVLEHIPMFAVDKILQQIRKKSARALFTISLKPSRARLPDGRNAHVTLLSTTEWMRWIAEYFGDLRMIKSSLEHEIVVLAGVV